MEIIMKKIFIVLVLICIFFTGCGKNSQSNVTNRIINNYKKSSGYKLDAELEIINNDDVYNYRVESSYSKKNDYYKVILTNKSNDFKQIIFKNKDGVFLLTPSMNKSFKFSSDWPYNNSQLYLYNTVISDIENDSSKKFEFRNNKYIYNTKVKYSNNSKLYGQKIIFDKKYKLNQVDVYDRDNNVCMKLTINKIIFSPRFSKDYFVFDKDYKTEKTKDTMSMDDIIYPLFLPSGTKLVEEKKINKDNGQRVIMTYDGEKSFLLVEETLDVFNDLTIIPTSGEPFQLMDTIGVMNDNSLNWVSGNMEYYLVSDVMGKEELVEIAQSIVGVQSVK